MRRLPGVYFEVGPPPPARVLPRMDVGAFVGLATAGPFDIPVALEDPAQFAAIFGEAPELALDPAVGPPRRGHLGAAVHAFFANGGRRCRVVRVGDGGQEITAAAVPGLVHRSAAGTIEPVALRARSAGSWADDLATGAALLSSPLAFESVDTATLSFRPIPDRRESLRPGDLLRLRDDGAALLVTVASVGDGEALGDPASVLWLEVRPQLSPPAAALAWLDGFPAAAELTRVPGEVGGDTAVEVAAAIDRAPQPGELVRLEVAGEDLWIAVRGVRPGQDLATMVVEGAGFWPAPAPRGGPYALSRAERLSLELWVRSPATGTVRMSGLAFAERHPRWIGRLPRDEDLYAPADADPRPPVPRPTLWEEASAPRFPLAGTHLPEDGALLPLGVTALPQAFLPVSASASPAVARNGLRAFGSGMFVDEALRGVRLDAVAATADFVRYGSGRPRPLRGIHALLSVDEVTLVAVPDAVHGGWSLDPAADPSPSTLVEDVDQPDPALFNDCSERVLATPVIDPPEPYGPGTVLLTWSATDAPDARYDVETSSDPVAFAGARQVHSGSELRLVLHPGAGVVYVRVQARATRNRSNWSLAVAVTLDRAERAVAATPVSPDPALLTVHRALLRMCAARGDLVALLSLPRGAREPDALAHLGALTAPEPAAGAGAPGGVSPLDRGEERALSFGAIHHPWIVAAIPGSPGFGATPPEGAVMGLLAARAGTRGAWVAAANVPVVGAVAVEPPLADGALAELQEAGLNVVRQTPDGFLWRSQETLSPNPDLRAVNVRRLLCLLRRLALLHGATYAFEPRDDDLRRLVERGFEELLADLYQLGAFTGATPDQAFQVRAGSPPNTPQDIDNGRFIVELRVAPSRPLVFLTVRLLHDAERGLAVLGS